jgi:TPR repeat protein
LKQVDNALKLIPEHKKLVSLKQSIEASFNPNSSYARAEKLYRGVDGPKDHSRAAFYYLKAAELGHILAMNAIGVAYADGDGIPRNDRLAMKWFEKSAKLDNSEAMYNLALGYHFSDVSDAKKALPWVLQAVDAEYRPAYMLIGWMTTTGTGTRANRVASIRWDLKGMVNPISDELHKQYRIPKRWQNAFMVRYKAATNTGP